MSARTEPIYACLTARTTPVRAKPRLFMVSGAIDPEDVRVYSLPCRDDELDHLEVSLEHPGALSNLPHDA